LVFRRRARENAGAAHEPGFCFGVRGTFFYSERSRNGILPVKKLMAAAILVAFATPSFAAEFYVVRDNSTKKCTILTSKPTTSTATTVMGDGTVYKTCQEAQTNMKKICTEG
jgi:hypothetical protein